MPSQSKIAYQPDSKLHWKNGALVRNPPLVVCSFKCPVCERRTKVAYNTVKGKLEIAWEDSFSRTIELTGQGKDFVVTGHKDITIYDQSGVVECSVCGWTKFSQIRIYHA